MKPFTDSTAYVAPMIVGLSSDITPSSEPISMLAPFKFRIATPPSDITIVPPVIETSPLQIPLSNEIAAISPEVLIVPPVIVISV